MVLVALLTQEIKFIQGRLLTIKRMVLDESRIKQGTLIMDSGSIIKNVALEFLNILKEMFTKDFGKMI